MRVMVVFFVAALAAGCRAYTGAEIALVDQARKGVATAAEREAAHRELVERLDKEQRQRLDAAFDADVHGEGVITADWVIEARRAYEAAVDAIEKQHAAAVAAGDVAKSNLEAADAALVRLRWLLSVQGEYSVENAWEKVTGTGKGK